MKFKIGVVVNQQVIPAWAFRMFEQLIKMDLVSSYTFFLINESKSDFKPVSDKFNLFSLYQKLENWKFNPQPSASCPQLITDLKKCSKNVKVVITSSEVLYRQIIRKKNPLLDVLINLNISNLPERAQQIVKYGIWKFSHTDEKSIKEGPPAFWELFENQPIIGCSLKVTLNKELNDLIVSKSYTSVEPISVNRNANLNFWKSASLLPREIAKMSKMGPDKYVGKLLTISNHVEFYDSRTYSLPTNKQFLSVFFKRLWGYLKFKYNYLTKIDQWVLMYKIGSVPARNLNTFNYIIPPKDRFWADPFIIYQEGLNYVFFEEALYSNPQHAYICCLIIKPDGTVEKPVKILHETYHLSYPFVFKYQDSYWMIPESSEKRTIDVYRCDNFPDKWHLHKTLMRNIEAYDTTLFHYENKWWLFANVVEKPGLSSWDELFLYYADFPLSDDWKSHPQNPIVSDVRNSRPAGNIFEYRGSLYRPAQNSSIRYGYGIKINKIIKMTEEVYEEITIDSIEPHFNRSIIAIHTLNFENNLTMIDAQKRRCRYF